MKHGSIEYQKWLASLDEGAPVAVHWMHDEKINDFNPLVHVDALTEDGNDWRTEHGSLLCRNTGVFCGNAFVVMPPALVVCKPTPSHNNYGLKLWGSARDVERLDEIAWRDLRSLRLDDPRGREKNSWGTCWQGHDPHWIYLEFWMLQSPKNWRKMVTKALEIGDEIGVDVRIGNVTGPVATSIGVEVMP